MLPNDVCRCAGLVGLSICKDRDQCQRYIHRSTGRVFAASMREAGKPCEFLIEPVKGNGEGGGNG